MTSRCSDSLHTLITFQGQESQMQATRMALWTKSRWALGVFYQAKAIWQVKIGYNGLPRKLSLQAASLTLGKSQEAILTARHVQFC